MFRLDKGALRLFRLFGIDVFLHWLWAPVVVLEIMWRRDAYQSLLWNALEYLTLFAIVLMHEFGHALACRSVGGKAERIVLWPLGGVAFVAPPQRPGAVLWSIFAGPLVNVVLAALAYGLGHSGLLHGAPRDVAIYVDIFYKLNVGLFIFNMLPFYPLDGGQIVQALLWFVIGRVPALLVVSVIGMVVGGVVLVASVVFQQLFLGLIAAFAAFRSFVAFNTARKMEQLASAPKRQEAACPQCGVHPPTGPFWRCACGSPFDAFGQPSCPRCGSSYDQASCTECHKLSPLDGWLRKSA